MTVTWGLSRGPWCVCWGLQVPANSELRLWGWLLDLDLDAYMGRGAQEDSQSQSEPPHICMPARLHVNTHRDT